MEASNYSDCRPFFASLSVPFFVESTNWKSLVKMLTLTIAHYEDYMYHVWLIPFISCAAFKTFFKHYHLDYPVILSVYLFFSTGYLGGTPLENPDLFGGDILGIEDPSVSNFAIAVQLMLQKFLKSVFFWPILH